MKLKSKRYLNINVALKILLLLGFAFFFLNSVVTGSVSLYVHPRIIPYLIFPAVVMIIMALLLLGELFKPHKQKLSLLSLAFLYYPFLWPLPYRPNHLIPVLAQSEMFSYPAETPFQMKPLKLRKVRKIKVTVRQAVLSQELKTQLMKNLMKVAFCKTASL